MKKRTKLNGKIILTNMFPNHAGYLLAGENVGHETINLFKADQGFYLYLNSSGTIDKSKYEFDQVNVIMLANVDGITGLYQIIGRAKECKLVDGAYITGQTPNLIQDRMKLQKQLKITYCGVKLEDILKGNISLKTCKPELNTMVTFTCKTIEKPQKPCFIGFDKCDITLPKGIFWKLGGVEKFSSNCRIIDKAINPQNGIQEQLEKIMVDAENSWQPVSLFEEVYNNKHSYKNNNENIISMLGVEKREISMSNIICKYLINHKDWQNEFLMYVCGIKDVKNNNFSIAREEGNVDILFSDMDKECGKIIIIENKVDACITPEKQESIKDQINYIFTKYDKTNKKDLNDDPDCNRIIRIINDLEDVSSKTNTISQLSKYYILAVYWAVKAGWDDQKIKKDIKCYLLCPEYSELLYVEGKNHTKYLDGFALSNQYKVITYKNIYEFFNNKLGNITNKSQEYYNLTQFVECLKIFTKTRDDYMERLNIARFIERFEKAESEIINNI